MASTSDPSFVQSFLSELGVPVVQQARPPSPPAATTPLSPTATTDAAMVAPSLAPPSHRPSAERLERHLMGGDEMSPQDAQAMAQQQAMEQQRALQQQAMVQEQAPPPSADQMVGVALPTFGRLEFVRGLVQDRSIHDYQEDVSEQDAEASSMLRSFGKMIVGYANHIVSMNNVGGSLFAGIASGGAVNGIMVANQSPLLMRLMCSIIVGVATTLGMSVFLKATTANASRLVAASRPGSMEPNASSTFLMTLLTAALSVSLTMVYFLETSWTMGVRRYDLTNNNSTRAAYVFMLSTCLACVVAGAVDLVLENYGGMSTVVRIPIYWTITVVVVTVINLCTLALKNTFGENPRINAFRTYYFYLPKVTLIAGTPLIDESGASLVHQTATVIPSVVLAGMTFTRVGVTGTGNDITTQATITNSVLKTPTSYDLKTLQDHLGLALKKKDCTIKAFEMDTASLFTLQITVTSDSKTPQAYTLSKSANFTPQALYPTMTDTMRHNQYDPLINNGTLKPAASQLTACGRTCDSSNWYMYQEQTSSNITRMLGKNLFKEQYVGHFIGTAGSAGTACTSTDSGMRLLMDNSTNYTNAGTTLDEYYKRNPIGFSVVENTSVTRSSYWKGWFVFNTALWVGLGVLMAFVLIAHNIERAWYTNQWFVYLLLMLIGIVASVVYARSEYLKGSGDTISKDLMNMLANPSNHDSSNLAIQIYNMHISMKREAAPPDDPATSTPAVTEELPPSLPSIPYAMNTKTLATVLDKAMQDSALKKLVVQNFQANSISSSPNKVPYERRLLINEFNALRKTSLFTKERYWGGGSTGTTTTRTTAVPQKCDSEWDNDDNSVRESLNLLYRNKRDDTTLPLDKPEGDKPDNSNVQQSHRVQLCYDSPLNLYAAYLAYRAAGKYDMGGNPDDRINRVLEGEKYEELREKAWAGYETRAKNTALASKDNRQSADAPACGYVLEVQKLDRLLPFTADAREGGGMRLSAREFFLRWYMQNLKLSSDSESLADTNPAASDCTAVARAPKALTYMTLIEDLNKAFVANIAQVDKKTFADVYNTHLIAFETWNKTTRRQVPGAASNFTTGGILSMFACPSESDTWNKITTYVGMANNLVGSPQYGLVGMFTLITLPILLLCVLYVYANNITMRILRGVEISTTDLVIIRMLAPVRDWLLVKQHATVPMATTGVDQAPINPAMSV
jgi:hypothetical protein